MKKIVALLLACIMLAGMCACGTKAADPAAKSKGVMTYAEYAAADLDSKVVIEAYVQDTQSWWQDKITVYAQDPDGAYFIYELACAEADAAKLKDGQKIKVTGVKSEWSGEIEIVDATFEIEDGKWTAEPVDVTDNLGNDDLVKFQNRLVSFTGMTVESEAIYKWDNSGSEGDDLYFNVSVNGQTYTFTVESYLRGSDTDVYQAVKALKVGDIVDMTGYLYWYNGANPHIISVKTK